MTIESTIRLRNDVEIPRLGLGVYRIEPGEPTRDAVGWALEAGYRLIDTAAAYGNEEDVGKAIRESDVPREEVFVTTKLWKESHGYDRTLEAFDNSLERLGFDYVDLYLSHWPVPELRVQSWRAMEEILESGRARAVGLSNYMVRHLDEILEHGGVVPAVNQIELTPFNYRRRRGLVGHCRANGIAVEAYSPLTKGRKLDDLTLVRMARKYGKTPAQVLIRWALERDFVVIPGSSDRDHIRENADVFDFRLEAGDGGMLEQLDQGLVTGWDPSDVP